MSYEDGRITTRTSPLTVLVTFVFGVIVGAVGLFLLASKT